MTALMTKEYFKQLRKDPEAALNYILNFLQVSLESDEKYPLNWNYQIKALLDDFKEESNE